MSEVERRAAGVLNVAAFWIFWLVFGVFLRLFFRLRVVNPPRLRGGYVVVANHASYLDPLLLGAASRRRLTFMISVLVYRSRALRWFFDWNRVIPVSARAANRDSMRAARAALRLGEALAIFPEGGLSRDGLLMLGSPGAAAIVLGEGVPVVPAGIEGAHAAFAPHARWPRPARVTVRFGAPIAPRDLVDDSIKDRRLRLHLATKRLMREIAALSGQRAREDVLEQARPALPSPAASRDDIAPRGSGSGAG